jgi:chromosome segregation ATPase
MSVSNFDPIDPKVELEVLRERLKHAEEKIRQLEEKLQQAYTDLGRKEVELQRLLTSSSPNSLGWVMIVTAIIVYFAGSVFITTKGGID